eukprot:c20847_g1_i1.p2 GENE.c20847_g1_i1~~c20847_g1_i1.p2  ORF type:complete len:152 (+),score=28.13 c20847_g1_i1:29-484(+)
MKVLTVLVLAAIVAVVNAHVCLLNPLQRGTMNDINTVGAADCGLFGDGPCGNRTQQPPMVAVQSGSQFNVVWQKNQDHFNSQPANWIISFAPYGSPFIQLAKFADTNTSSLTIGTQMVTIPNLGTVAGVMQIQYAVGFGTFYQCSDIAIIE